MVSNSCKGEGGLEDNLGVGLREEVMGGWPGVLDSRDRRNGHSDPECKQMT